MAESSDLASVVRRFLRYVEIDTQADRDSAATPSTEKQKNLGRLLVRELQALGLEDAAMDEHGYVYARLAPTPEEGASAGLPTVALLAHMDTSPDEPGGPVKAIIHRHYDGSKLTLPGDTSVTLDPQRSPELTKHIGHDLITSDGTTLLGSDDKAGVAVIMQLVEDLLADPGQPRPPIAVCFTVDEEIGRGVDKIDLERLGAQIAYTVDGSGTANISFETFNAAEAVIEVQGVNVHPGYAKDVMANAITILSAILDRLPSSETPESTTDRQGYFCPFEMTGSISSAKAKMLLRDFKSEGLERRKALVESLVAAARLEHPRAKIELTIEDQYKNMRNYIEDVDRRAVSFAFEAAETMGMQMKDELVRGGTDGSRLSEMGLPTPNIFSGGHDFHSRFEWNTVQNLELSLAYVKQLVATWAERGGD